MISLLSAAARVFPSISPSLATRDRDWVNTNSEWTASNPVDVNAIREKVAEYSELVGAGKVYLPLHELDSPELTNEYLLFSDSTVVPCYAYEDESGEITRIGVDEINKTRFTQQLWFWSDNFATEVTPSYAAEAEGTEQTELEFNGDGIEEEKGIFDRLERSIEEEIEAEREERRDAFTRVDFGAFRAQYGGVNRVKPKTRMDSVEGTIYTASAEVPLTSGDIYPGNEVIVDADMRASVPTLEDVENAFPAEAVVEDVQGDRIEFILLTERSPEKAPEGMEAVYSTPDATLTIAPLYNPVPFDREKDAIAAVKESPDKRRVLTGEADVDWDDEGNASFEDLNESQAEAARKATGENPFVLIHGPPGTGKTRTLIEITQRLIEEGNRVLACAHSNQATDNLLVGSSTPEMPDIDSLHYETFGGMVKMARVGSGSKSKVVNDRYADRNPDKANVVGATMSAAATFDDDEFDVAIVDEASQASIPATLIPFSKAEKIVLAGDHKQLPPYTATERGDKEMVISLYEHLINEYGEAAATMLRTQYRMNEHIADFPNKQFYGSRLETAEQNRDWTIDDLDSVHAVQVAGEEKQTFGYSYRNEVEAKEVVNEVMELRKHEVGSDNIGIITPYTGQIGAIEEALDDAGISESIKVDTIDSFQGSEREAIIVSLVRSNDEHSIGFLGQPEEGPRRLNVAMTRARKRLVLIGDWTTLCGSEENPHETYAALRQWLAERGWIEERSTNSAS